MVTRGIVLDHIISPQGIEVDKAKVSMIKNLPTPTNIRDIRAFLGHVGFYRRFIKDFSKIARPLTHLLQLDTPFNFNEACVLDFDTLKEALVSAPIIQSPDWDLPFELMCDASDYAVGAVLGQRKEKQPIVVYYTSKYLNDVQRNYTTTKKEMLTVVFCIREILALYPRITHHLYRPLFS